MQVDDKKLAKTNKLYQVYGVSGCIHQEYVSEDKEPSNTTWHLTYPVDSFAKEYQHVVVYENQEENELQGNESC